MGKRRRRSDGMTVHVDAVSGAGHSVDRWVDWMIGF